MRRALFIEIDHARETFLRGRPDLLAEIVERIRPRQGANRSALLRRLVNQEIAHYARYAMKYPGRTAIRLSDLYLPEGTGTAALLLAAKLIPAPLRQSGHALRNRMRARA